MIKKICILLGLATFVTLAIVGGIRYRKYKRRNGPLSYLTIVGPVHMSDGIARQSAELANALMDQVSVNLIPTIFTPTDVPKRIVEIIKKKDRRLGKVVVFEDVLCRKGFNPENFFQSIRNDNQIRIAYTMLESNRIPAEWVMLLNLYFDAVAVPDSFLVEVYRSSGVQIPIFELPLGLDLKNFRERPLKTKRNSPMVFANFGSCINRKNQLATIRAFNQAFGDRRDVVLKINCREATPELRQAVVEEILKLKAHNIFFTEAALKKDAYLSMFSTVDCYVSLSQGEGFSIQPREAMILGIPVIATKNSGQITICNTNLVKHVDSKIPVDARYPEFEIPPGYWFDCKVDDAADAMREVYENYDQYLANAQEAREWASQYDYSNTNLHDRYVSLVQPKRIILGHEDKLGPDFMMTTSPELFEKYQRLGCVQK